MNLGRRAETTGLKKQCRRLPHLGQDMSNSDLNDMSNIFEGFFRASNFKIFFLVGIHIQIFLDVLKKCLPMESLALQCSLLLMCLV